MSGHHTHAARPLDLPALISFDGNIAENQAVPATRFGHGEGEAPHALGAALNQWLRRGHTWIDVNGRRVDGIATAREVEGLDDDAARVAWEIDTLVEAPGERGGDVAQRLLEQTVSGATESGVHSLLLRLHPDAPAIEDALRAGFRQVYAERLWRGQLRFDGDAPAPPSALEVRPLGPADVFAEFQLYHRAIPAPARQALAVTFEEWGAVQDRRWLGRRQRRLGAFEAGRLRAVLRHGRSGGASEPNHAEMLTDPTLGADVRPAVAALFVAAGEGASSEGWLVYHPEPDAGAGTALGACGLDPAATYVLLSRRIAEAMREEATARTRVAVTTGG